MTEGYDHLLRLNVPPTESTGTLYHSAALVGGNDDALKCSLPDDIYTSSDSPGRNTQIILVEPISKCCSSSLLEGSVI